MLDDTTRQEITSQLHTSGCSCVIYSHGHVTEYRNRGVKDLFMLLENTPESLRGAFVADKVVGKGAAALMATGGVDEVYADVISQPALSLLSATGIKVTFGQCVPGIINRSGSGPCPVERLCADVDNPRECIPLIRNFIESQE